MDEADLRYEYILALCSAIEQYTALAIRRNPLAFTYRGADLRFALERYLYFSHVENHRLLALFQESRSGKPVISGSFHDPCEASLAQIICPRVIARTSRMRDFVNMFMVCGRRARRALRTWLRWVEMFLPRLAKQSVSSPPVLVFIAQEKFARYLAPILDRLKERCAVLLLSDRYLCEKLRAQGVPTLSVPKGLLPLTSVRDPIAILDLFAITETFDRMFATLIRVRPKCVVLVEGNAPTDEVLNQACKLLGISTVCIQQGWSPIVHNGFRNMSYGTMLVWGDVFASALAPFNPDQKFQVTGSHILEQTMRELPGRNDRKRVAVSFFLQAPGPLISERRFGEFLELLEWTALSFPDVPVLVREHPSYRVGEDKREMARSISNVRFVDPDRVPLADVLAESLISVSVYSTTILESIGAGVIPIIFNATSLPKYYPDLDSFGVAIEVHDLLEAKNAVASLLNDNNRLAALQTAMATFRSCLFGSGQASSTDRIAEAICPKTWGLQEALP